MSVSEARRQIEQAMGWKEISELSGTTESKFLPHVLAHGFSAVVEALASTMPYDGDLNAIRIPTSMLRQISLELINNDLEDIGLEDFIRAVRARLKSSGLDNHD